MVCVLLATLLAGQVAAETGEPLIMSHQAQLVFNIDAHTVQISDHLVVPAGVLDLRLGGALKVESLSHSDGTVLDRALVMSEETDEDGSFHLIDLAACGFSDAGGELILKYSGTFHESVEDVVFSRENVGGEITATISDEGIYLSGSAEWLAWNSNVLVTHDLSFDTPVGFETVHAQFLD